MAAESLPGPRFVRYFGPVLSALADLGGSGRPAEVAAKVAGALNITEAELAETIESGTPRFMNQVRWARFYLAKAGLIDASRRGVWSLTDSGRVAIPMSHSKAVELFKTVHQTFAEAGVEAETEDTPEAPSLSGPPTSAVPYRQALATRIKALSATGFERFCQRLLREAGFAEVTVTGRSGDGGIDGIGVLQVGRLVTFKVLFQCKRYTSSASVAPSHVRDFRGAMQGRADKGIILTTGTFTTDARKEAVRDGVPPIELVDGEALLDMCEEFEVGLKPHQTFVMDDALFTEIE
jgi:restriction system protein